ncbi:hypothetical protein RISK_001084 [Rhodopirellula islandica]|uniref:Uncharacterized protein n=1 Tax=Rhodopirellula islandica TaxID=595434 RepID=A0A0J1BJN5_RHOIS|nr:hypothetical protein RISK_001084 [Rhodopirellula islandica]
MFRFLVRERFRWLRFILIESDGQNRQNAGNSECGWHLAVVPLVGSVPTKRTAPSAFSRSA